MRLPRFMRRPRPEPSPPVPHIIESMDSVRYPRTRHAGCATPRVDHDGSRLPAEDARRRALGGDAEPVVLRERGGTAYLYAPVSDFPTYSAELTSALSDVPCTTGVVADDRTYRGVWRNLGGEDVHLFAEPEDALLIQRAGLTPVDREELMTTDETTRYGGSDMPRAGTAADPSPINPAATTQTRLENPPTSKVERQACEHCRGTGKVLTVNDLLSESLALLGDSTDDVVGVFYESLLRIAPHLAALFPPDLFDPLSEPPTEANPRTGRGQRDKLVAALAALASSYDPDDPEKMAILDTHLAAFGRSHGAFRRQDGTVRGATVSEYHYVKVVLFDTLHDAALDAWRPEYDDAWDEAYEYAARHMLAAQDTVRDGFGRFPRA
jgi:hemoglobin-like flavoprotein